MAKQFDIEVREAFDDKYLKIFIRDISKIEDVRAKVSSLSSVKNANITESQSSSNPRLTLTVYTNKVYDIEETKKEVETMLKGYFNGTSTIVEEPVIRETKDWLSSSPKAKKLYDDALDKYNKKEYDRNVLDDMRLSLETHLKTVLGNNKSLENQLSEVGMYITKKGLSKELANMFRTLLDYYGKYQNTHVKHNDAVNKGEIDFIIQQTTAFMRVFL